ncbi:MAG: VIT domain-containing protein [Sandaracinaceae bacterium]|nr:VIT domain-containing protein [Sandaracinaceae bacterium]
MIGGLVVQSCSPSSGGTSAARETTAARVSPSGVLRRIDAPPPAPPSREDLLHEALAGVVDASEETLDARMQVRPIRVPRPPRGATSRFNFGEGRRGWITALPRAELLTSPAFANGRVFLGGGFASHQFYAFDAYDGELAWSIAAPDGGPTAAIVEDGKVVFNTESCTIFVADAESGELLWSRWLGDPLMSQPAAANGLVFSAYPKNGGHEFGAFRLADGEPVWATPIEADVIQAPQVAGDSVYFATMDGTAYRLDARTGRVRWARDVGASSAVWVDRSSVLLARRTGNARAPREQMIVLGAQDGRLRHEGEHFDAAYLSGQSRDRELARGQAGAWGNVPHGEHLGLTNVAAGWAFQGSSPAVADGRAYFAVSGEILARDMETAEAVWRRRYAQAEGAQALSPPAVVGALLVFGTVDGHLFATDIDTGLTVWAYDVGEPVVFQPIVAQGWVYVATGRGNLIGLELGDAMLDGWHMWGGNARHAGLVETAGQVDPRYLASLERPTRGTLRAVAASVAQEDGEEAPAPAEMEERELPLRGTEVSARLSGGVAEVFVTQRFENDGPEPIEAVYLFPLPADAAVDRMEMRVGDRVVRGVIRERQEARRVYEEARSEGRRAALLEQQRPNLFAQRVANIQPGDRIDVRLRYVQALPFEDGRYELAYPLSAPRRFDPSDPARAAGDEAATSATSARIDQQPPVTLHVELDAGLPIAEIASPSHERAALERPEPHRATVHAELSGEALRDDFVLRYALGGETPEATVLAHREGEDGFFTLLVQPPRAPADATIAPRDVTFVVDTSSSMHGRPLEHARAVIRRVIESLRESDRFDVLGFSDGVTAMSGTPVPRDAGSAERAITFVDGLRATGTTRMVPAIERALATQTERGRLSIVVLLTDGYIANEAEVLRALATNLGEHRVYAFGVGASVNRFLIERAAEIGRGRALVTPLSEEPARAADRFVGWIDRPVFTDVEVDFGGLAVEDVYPRRVPDLFAGKPLSIQGRFARGGRGTLRVRGTVGGVRYERAIEVSLPSAPTPDGRHASQATLWARAAVRDRMNRLTLRDDPQLIAEVTRIGLAHHLVTPWTSFVAVEERPAEPAPEGEEEARATVSPARALPGDPEIRVPAPADARAVTVVLPFGESISAAWEPDLGVWSARFLIPRDADEGTYPIEILVTHADGRLEHLRLWYTVDATAALVHLELDGEARPGETITIRAEQVITEADLAQVGRRPGELSAERVLLLSDARRVEVRTPGGEVIDLAQSGPGSWEGEWTLPADASGTLRLDVVVVDLAANVTHQRLDVEVVE